MNRKTNLLELAEISVVYKNKIREKDKIQIMSSNDIYKLMKPVYEDVINHHEEFYIILLNTGNYVLGISKIAQGGISSTTIDTRIILQTALKTNSVKIALVHNHPSTNLQPSSHDKDFTNKIVKAGKLMDIKVLDHVIISDNGYFSFCDDGIIN